SPLAADLDRIARKQLKYQRLGWGDPVPVSTYRKSEPPTGEGIGRSSKPGRDSFWAPQMARTPPGASALPSGDNPAQPYSRAFSGRAVQEGPLSTSNRIAS